MGIPKALTVQAMYALQRVSGPPERTQSHSLTRLSRGEAKLCEQYIKEPNDKPTYVEPISDKLTVCRGYTHVLDTSILANRVAQLEAVLSRLLTRVDSVAVYNDLLHEWKDPLPAFKPKDQEEREASQSKGNEDSKADIERSEKRVKRRDSNSTEASRPVSVGLSSTMAPPATPGMLGMTPARFNPNLSADTENAGMSSGTVVSGTTISPTAFGQQNVGMDMNYLGAGGPETDPSAWLGFGHKPTPSGSFHNPFAETDQGRAFVDNDHGRGGSSFEPASKAPSAHEHDAALALEGMALGRELLSSAIGKASEARDDGDNEPTPGSPLTFSSFIHHKRSFKPEGQLKRFPEVQELPSIIFGKYIINHFLENVDFRWRCLHRPTFEQQYNELSNRLRSKSIEFYREELSTLALYASCLAVGIHFLDEDGYRDLNLNEEQSENLAATCWKVSHAALEASDWMQVHDIRSCQTIM